MECPFCGDKLLLDKVTGKLGHEYQNSCVFNDSLLSEPEWQVIITLHADMLRWRMLGRTMRVKDTKESA